MTDLHPDLTQAWTEAIAAIENLIRIREGYNNEPIILADLIIGFRVHDSDGGVSGWATPPHNTLGKGSDMIALYGLIGYIRDAIRYQLHD